MPMTDLITALRTDLADPAGKLFSDEVLNRCILKSAYPLARDLNIGLSIVGSEIQPDLQGETREMLLLLAQIHACQYMRAATANAFSFSSGDKNVDKTKQPEHWARLENDLKTQYLQRLN